VIPFLSTFLRAVFFRWDRWYSTGSSKSRRYWQVGQVVPVCAGLPPQIGNLNGAPTDPTVQSHQKSAELPAVPPVTPVPPGTIATLARE
jgi:hypothetical protein